MTAKGWVRAYRAGFAMLALAAIAYQFWNGTLSPGFRPVNFFSFFTIQSNLVAAAVLLWVSSGAAARWPAQTVDLVRGAAVLYMSVTGVVYGLLLAGLELQLTLPWVDTVLHRLMPLVLVFDWLIEPPSERLELRRALVWLVYPLAYAAYSLVRGPFAGWYPYPFLDPGQGGYGVVALYCVGISLGALLFTGLVVFAARFRLVSRTPSGP